MHKLAHMIDDIFHLYDHLTDEVHNAVYDIYEWDSCFVSIEEFEMGDFVRFWISIDYETYTLDMYLTYEDEGNRFVVTDYSYGGTYKWADPSYFESKVKALEEKLNGGN